jgi:prepilin-type N-terminal cleavage/methylation domain-containing protein
MELFKREAFSLLEIIFAIAIISIIAIIAIPKLGNSLDKTNIIKIKSDILLIRDGLNRYKINRF